MDSKAPAKKKRKLTDLCGFMGWMYFAEAVGSRYHEIVDPRMFFIFSLVCCAGWFFGVIVEGIDGL